MSAPTDLAALVSAVKNHALAHYEEGWDVVVETMDDDDLAAKLTEAAATTPAAAIAALAPVVELWRERTGPHHPPAFCPTHPQVRLTSVFPEEPPSECARCIHEADQRQHLPDLWWDDASYIRYQSEDPYAEEPDPGPQLTLLTDHTTDLCDGANGYKRRHRCPACTKSDADADDYIPF